MEQIDCETFKKMSSQHHAQRDWFDGAGIARLSLTPDLPNIRSTVSKHSRGNLRRIGTSDFHFGDMTFVVRCLIGSDMVVVSDNDVNSIQGKTIAELAKCWQPNHCSWSQLCSGDGHWLHRFICPYSSVNSPCHHDGIVHAILHGS